MQNPPTLANQWLHPSYIYRLFLGDKNSQIWLSSLDGVRAIAVLLVFIAHGKRLFENHFPEDGTILGFYLNTSSLGRTGVYLFFILSSFLLTSHLLKPTLKLNQAKIWLNYTLRRFLRIYPLYIFILLVYGIFPSFQYTIQNVINHLLLQEGKNHFWTIVVEFKYYMILPFIVCLIVIILKRHFQATLLFLITTIGLLEIFNILVDNQIIFANYDLKSTISILPHLPIFLIGSLAAVIHEKLSQYSSDIHSKIKPWMSYTALISLFLIAFLIPNVWIRSLWSLISVNDFNQLSPNHWIYTIHAFLWSVFLITHLYGQPILKTILSYPLLRFIGVISFGMYIWHISILGYLEAHIKAPSFIVFLIVLLITMFVASCSYLLIERPFMKVKIKF